MLEKSVWRRRSAPSAAGNPTWPLVRRLARRRGWIIAAILALIVAGVGVGLAPSFIGGRIVDALVARDLSTIVRFAVLLLLISAGGGLIGALEGFLVTLAGEWFGRDLRVAVYAHIQRLPLRFFRGRPQGELMNRVDGDIDQLTNALVGSIEPTIASLIMLVLTVAIMLSVNWELTLVAISTVPLWILAARPAGTRLKELRRRVLIARDRVGSFTNETLGYDGIAIVKGFGALAAEAERFRTTFENLMNLRIASTRITRSLQAVLSTISGLGPGLVLVFGAWLVLRGQTSLGTVVAFLTLQSRLYAPAGQLANLRLQLATLETVLARVGEALGDEIEDPSAEPWSPPDWSLACESLSYEIDGCPVLRDLSFAVPEGARVAIVGPSGCGKTTLASLLVRHDEPRSGRILAGGVPIASAPPAALRRALVLVPQRSTFFTRSIRENVVLGMPEASDEDVARALALVDAGPTIARLPAGLDTVIGTGATKLSGGEQQRLAIARAVLAQPRVLVLDEATSALDAESERRVLRALDAACPATTLIFVTHHPERLPRVDAVVDLGALALAAPADRTP
jgi:ATP-binding cassette, subfamily B, bacterial